MKKRISKNLKLAKSIYIVFKLGSSYNATSHLEFF